MAGVLDKIYAKSPVVVQNLGVTLFGVVWKNRRYGGIFRQRLEEFKQRESFRHDEWLKYQERELRAMLVHAFDSVPYYSRSFEDARVTRSELLSFEMKQIAQLPTITKGDLRREPGNFIATTHKRAKLHRYATSGTTGTPVSIYMSSAVHQSWLAAYEARCRNWAGVDRSMSRAMIGGRMVVPKAESKPPFWRFNHAEQQLYMSAFHISPTNVPHYVRALNEYKPKYLVGYASSHFFLARMIEEQSLKVHRPLAVLTSSEKLTPEMRDQIQRTYGCEVFDGYSGLEACCLASECEHHNLHLSPDVGLVELLNEDGFPVAPDEIGEIVATGFLNNAQPLIRYRTGDFAVVSSEQCPCRRHMPFLSELVGRLEDTVVGSDGRELVRFHGIFLDLPHVREGQVIQETLTRFRIRLVVSEGFSEAENAIIRERMETRLGKITLEIELVDSIERTERGKYKAVISRVNRKPLKVTIQ